MASSWTVPVEKLPFDVTTAWKVVAPAALVSTSNSELNSPSDPSAPCVQRRTRDRSMFMASYGACRADGAEVVAPRHRRARWSYWLMLQVNGTVAARPWSALVTTPESSSAVTT